MFFFSFCLFMFFFKLLNTSSDCRFFLLSFICVFRFRIYINAYKLGSFNLYNFHSKFFNFLLYHLNWRETMRILRGWKFIFYRNILIFKSITNFSFSYGRRNFIFLLSNRIFCDWIWIFFLFSNIFSSCKIFNLDLKKKRRSGQKAVFVSNIWRI